MPSPHSFRRRIGAMATVAVVVGLLGAVAVNAPAGAKGKAPVKLDGKVNNKGIGKVANGKVALEADDFYFKKTFVKGAAGDVTVAIENEGSATHSFTIDDQDIDEVIQAGKTATVTVSLTGNSEAVVFYCKFHASSGMQGAFYTAAGAAATPGSGSKSSGPGGYDYG